MDAFQSVDILISRLMALFKITSLIIEDNLIPSVPSVRISIFPSDGKTYDELYMLADERMYHDEIAKNINKSGA